MVLLGRIKFDVGYFASRLHGGDFANGDCKAYQKNLFWTAFSKSKMVGIVTPVRAKCTKIRKVIGSFSKVGIMIG